jgi:general secretion pathway protein G
MRNYKGFTLVEILIVVIILGILAAIVIPQFTEASSDARKSALQSDLQTLRSQVELFKVQHADLLPGATAAAPTTFDATVFKNQLMSKTDIDGTVDATAGVYGPYVQTFPKNPFAKDGVQDTVVIGTSPSSADPTTSGWYYDTSVGKMYASGYTTY